MEHYQLNMYYGIFYPAAAAKFVLGSLRHGPYAALTQRDAELVIKADAGGSIDETVLFVSMNADNNPSVGFIAIDATTHESDEFTRPTSATCEFTPGTLMHFEEAYLGAIDTLTGVYAVIVDAYRKGGRDVHELYMGWSAVVCTWEDDSESSISLCSSDDDEPPRLIPASDGATNGGSNGNSNGNSNGSRGKGPKRPAKRTHTTDVPVHVDDPTLPPRGDIDNAAVDKRGGKAGRISNKTSPASAATATIGKIVPERIPRSGVKVTAGRGRPQPATSAAPTRPVQPPPTAQRQARPSQPPPMTVPDAMSTGPTAARGTTTTRGGRAGRNGKGRQPQK